MPDLLAPDVCRTVVLDSNYVRGAHEAELAALVERGFKLSVSILTLEEVWARSTRESLQPWLERRLGLLVKYLDPECPLQPAGQHFTHFLAHDRSILQQRLRALWAHVCEGCVTAETWKQAGDDANAEITELGRGHVDSVLQTKELKLGGVADVPEGLLVPSLSRDIAAAAHVTELQFDRMQAYFYVYALIAVRAAQGIHYETAEENDAEDLQLLMQLAQPAFVATKDKTLVRRVDESGTYQAPWVRTIGELLVESLPSGAPWGWTAFDARQAFPVSPRHGARWRELMRREELELKKIRTNYEAKSTEL